MKSSKIITAAVIGSILASTMLVASPANARIIRVVPGPAHPGPNFGQGIGRPGCGWGGCNRHWHHGHWGWGGALAGAAIVGAIATAAAANQGNCQLAIYDGAGNFVGYRQGNC